MVTEESRKALQYRQKHIEVSLLREQNYRNKNSKELALKTAKWREHNPEKYKKQYQVKKDRLLNDDNYRKKWQHYDMLRRRVERENIKKLVFAFLGDQCVDCGYNENVLALEIGHRFDDGNMDRQYFGTTLNIMKYILDEPEDAIVRLKLICCNCNRIQEMIRRLYL